MATQFDKVMALLQRLYREDPDVTVMVTATEVLVDTDVDLESDNQFFENNGWERTTHSRSRTVWRRVVDGRWKEEPGEESRPRRAR